MVFKKIVNRFAILASLKKKSICTKMQGNERFFYCRIEMKIAPSIFLCVLVNLLGFPFFLLDSILIGSWAFVSVPIVH